MNKSTTKYTAQETAALRDDGMTLQEIADAMGMEYNEVRNILYRALRKLRMKTIAREEKAEDFYETLRSRTQHEQ